MKKIGTCENCGRIVLSGDTLFQIRIDIYAKGGPLEIEPEDLEKDHIAEMKALIAKMEQMDVQELTDEVWESYRFDLCAKCRKAFHKKLRLRATGQYPRSLGPHIHN